MQKLGDILSERAQAHFAGREREVDTLLGSVREGWTTGRARPWRRGHRQVQPARGVCGARACAGDSRRQDRLPQRRTDRAGTPDRAVGRLGRTLVQRRRRGPAVVVLRRDGRDRAGHVRGLRAAGHVDPAGLRPVASCECAPGHREPQPAVAGVANGAGLAGTLPKPAARSAVGDGRAALPRLVGHPRGRRTTNQPRRAWPPARLEHVGIDRAVRRRAHASKTPACTR